MRVLPWLCLLVLGCFDMNREVVVDRELTFGRATIAERIERQETFHDPIYEHRWRVRLDGEWSELGTLRGEDDQRIDLDRPPHFVGPDLVVPVGRDVFLKPPGGDVSQVDPHPCSNTWGLVVEEVTQTPSGWRVVWTGPEDARVVREGRGTTWSCVEPANAAVRPQNVSSRPSPPSPERVDPPLP